MSVTYIDGLFDQICAHPELGADYAEFLKLALIRKMPQANTLLLNALALIEG